MLAMRTGLRVTGVSTQLPRPTEFSLQLQQAHIAHQHAHRFLLMTDDRKAACEGYAARDACRSDTAHNCVWLDDILGTDTSSSSSSSSSSSGRAQRPAAAKGTASAERVSGVPPNLFTARMAAMQAQFGSAHWRCVCIGLVGPSTEFLGT